MVYQITPRPTSHIAIAPIAAIPRNEEADVTLLEQFLHEGNFVQKR